MQKNNLDAKEFTPGKNILFFSLEMPYENCFNRFIARLAKVNYRKIENATLNEDEIARLNKVLRFIKRYPFHFEIVDISNATPSDIESIYKEATIDKSFDVIVIDYLGIMEPDVGQEEADWLKQK
jgi:replicative DNA helicase